MFKMLNIVLCGIIQNNFTVILALKTFVIYAYFYGPIKKQMLHNTTFLPYFSLKKYLCFGMMDILEEYIKNEKVLTHIFCL